MSKRVILCDDEAHILRALEFKFKRGGYDVQCTFDGEEAWEAICEKKPDFVITDCQMPQLDGLGLVRRIRENAETRSLPVIMLTAKGYELAERLEQFDYGILSVVAKPFSPRDLFDRVEQVLNAGADAAAAPALTT